jgi:hypothetical protein
VPLFHRSHDDQSPPPQSAYGTTAESDSVASTLGRFAALSVPERAAEILEKATASIEQDALTTMHQLLAPWLRDSDWMKLSRQERENWLAFEAMLQEAFQALVLARMVIRRERDMGGATLVTYINSPDGIAALGRGDVADVVARRLPD